MPRSGSRAGRELAIAGGRSLCSSPPPQGSKACCSPPGRKICVGQASQAFSSVEHHPSLPFLRAWVGSCLSKGWSHTGAAEMHLLSLAGDTFLARRKTSGQQNRSPPPAQTQAHSRLQWGKLCRTKKAPHCEQSRLGALCFHHLPVRPWTRHLNSGALSLRYSSGVGQEILPGGILRLPGGDNFGLGVK